jgi:hypothetical protein
MFGHMLSSMNANAHICVCNSFILSFPSRLPSPESLSSPAVPVRFRRPIRRTLLIHLLPLPLSALTLVPTLVVPLASVSYFFDPHSP